MNAVDFLRTAAEQYQKCEKHRKIEQLIRNVEDTVSELENSDELKKEVEKIKEKARSKGLEP